MEARFKFNGGQGAILCGRCSVVIKTPATEEEFKNRESDLCLFCQNIKPKMD